METRQKEWVFLEKTQKIRQKRIDFYARGVLIYCPILYILLYLMYLVG